MQAESQRKEPDPLTERETPERFYNQVEVHNHGNCPTSRMPVQAGIIPGNRNFFPEDVNRIFNAANEHRHKFLRGISISDRGILGTCEGSLPGLKTETAICLNADSIL
jgi:hypothetical protein